MAPLYGGRCNAIDHREELSMTRCRGEGHRAAPTRVPPARGPVDRVTAPRRRLPIRIVVLSPTVMTAALVTGVAAVLDHCCPDPLSGAVEGPLTTWLDPEQVAGNGRPSGPGLRLAGPSEQLAGAG